MVKFIEINGVQVKVQVLPPGPERFDLAFQPYANHAELGRSWAVSANLNSGDTPNEITIGERFSIVAGRLRDIITDVEED